MGKIFNDIFKPIIVLFLICVIIPLALALTNSATSDRIAELQQKNETETMQKLVKAENYEPNNFSDGETKFNYYIAKNGETAEGYIFTTSAKGYGGEVSVMTAVSSEGKIIEVAVLDVSNETPGLGQNATKKSFYSQYEDKKRGVELVVKATPEEGKNQVMAISGATITSTAVNNAVNEALDNFKMIKDNFSEVTGIEK